MLCFSVQYWVCKTLIFNPMNETNCECFFYTMWWLCSVASVDQYGYCIDSAILLAALEREWPASHWWGFLQPQRKWPWWHCGTLHSSIHGMSMVNCVLARLFRFGTPIEFAEPLVYVLGLRPASTIGLRMDILCLYHSFCSRHGENEFWVLGFRFATVALHLW